MKKPVETIAERDDKEVEMDADEEFFIKVHKRNGYLLRNISEKQAEDFVNGS